jgi:hypothetical protein
MVLPARLVCKINEARLRYTRELGRTQPLSQFGQTPFACRLRYYSSYGARMGARSHTLTELHTSSSRGCLIIIILPSSSRSLVSLAVTLTLTMIVRP